MPSEIPRARRPRAEGRRSVPSRPRCRGARVAGGVDDGQPRAGVVVDPPSRDDLGQPLVAPGPPAEPGWPRCSRAPSQRAPQRRSSSHPAPRRVGLREAVWVRSSRLVVARCTPSGGPGPATRRAIDELNIGELSSPAVWPRCLCHRDPPDERSASKTPPPNHHADLIRIGAGRGDPPVESRLRPAGPGDASGCSTHAAIDTAALRRRVPTGERVDGAGHRHGGRRPPPSQVIARLGNRHHGRVLDEQRADHAVDDGGRRSPAPSSSRPGEPVRTIT